MFVAWGTALYQPAKSACCIVWGCVGHAALRVWPLVLTIAKNGFECVAVECAIIPTDHVVADCYSVGDVDIVPSIVMCHATQFSEQGE